MLLALFVAGCALPSLPPARTRAEACARLADNQATELRRNDFCTPGGLDRCGKDGSEQLICSVAVEGFQTACVSNVMVNRSVPAQACGPRATIRECLPHWQCLPYDHPQLLEDDPLFWCFPGPPCGSSEDAAVDAAVDAAREQ